MFITYIKTGLVPQITLVMGGFVVLAAIQSYFSGLILSTIAQKSKQDLSISWCRRRINLRNLSQRTAIKGKGR